MFDRLEPSFEPSFQTKQAMQFVRKRSLLLGGIRHPGLFGIDGHTVDWVWFLVALLLELAGLFALGSSLTQDPNAPFTATILLVAALFSVDILLAVYHHRFSTGVNARLDIENTLWSKSGGKEAVITVERNTEYVRKRKRIALGLSVMLVLMAALKVVLFAGLASGDSTRDAAVIFISVAYLITAIIHIKVTGYLLHGVWAVWLHGRDIQKFMKSNGNACVASEQNIELPDYPDFHNLIAIQHHAIVTDKSPGNGQAIYELRCRGLLFDREIEEFANKIKDDKARSEFVLKAMELQLRML